MALRLRTYQEKVKDQMVNDAVEHLINNPNQKRTILLVAGTGAGKTLICSRTLKEIFQNNIIGNNVAFVWLSPGKGGLHKQSLEAVKTHLNQSGLNVTDIAGALSSCPDNMAGNVVVGNWESLNKDGDIIKSKFLREDEVNNFQDMCSNTKNHNVPIILILDEAHEQAGTARSNQIIELINPSFVIKMTATPSDAEFDEDYKIDFKEIVRSGMVKKTLIHQECATYRDGIRSVADKLKDLIVLAAATTNTFSPKSLVFLDNAKKGEDQLQECLTILKDEYGWSEENGDIVQWFSDNKSDNHEKCKDNLSTVKFIFTKSAIGTGVDIPSINIIAQFPGLKNNKTQVQKFGRGMRMPEQKHYKNDLDTLFIFTFFTGVEFDFDNAEYLKDYLQQKSTKIRNVFGSPKFSNVLQGERAGRLPSVLESDDFASLFLPKFEQALKDQNNLNYSSSYDITLEQNKVEFEETLRLKKKKNINKSDGITHVDQSVVTVDPNDINLVYENSFAKMQKHFIKHLDSMESVVQHFLSNNGYDICVMTFILNNKIVISSIIDECLHQLEDDNISHEAPTKYDYNIPSLQSLKGKNCKEETPNKYLYDVYYSEKEKSKPEILFEEYIDNHQKVEWWYRNPQRQHDDSYGVIYNSVTGKQATFYPDYIVKVHNDHYLIVDTKSGTSDQNETSKKEALVNAVKNNSKIVAGIVKPEGQNNLFLSGTKDGVLSLIIDNL